MSARPSCHSLALCPTGHFSELQPPNVGLGLGEWPTQPECECEVPSPLTLRLAATELLRRATSRDGVVRGSPSADPPPLSRKATVQDKAPMPNHWSNHPALPHLLPSLSPLQAGAEMTLSLCSAGEEMLRTQPGQVRWAAPPPRRPDPQPGLSPQSPAPLTRDCVLGGV